MGVKMTIKLAPLALLLCSTLFAQRQGVVRGPNATAPGPNAFPFGNILFPGGTPTFPQRLGNTVSGIIPNHGGFVSPPFNRGERGERGGGRERTVVVPFAYPIYFGDPGYGYGGGYNQPQQPPVTVVTAPQQATPMVIINQTFVPDSANPVLRDYSGQETPDNDQSSSGVKVYKTPVQPRPAPTAATPPVDDRATIFLIALKDNSIHTAVGYWIKDGTLHYVTPQGSENRVTLDQVDKDLSDRLNAERHVEFQLKGK
jgi:hypothetical protein